MVPRAVEGARAAEVAAHHRAVVEVGCHRGAVVAECHRAAVVAESTRAEVRPQAAASPRVAAKSRRVAVEGEWAVWS